MNEDVTYSPRLTWSIELIDRLTSREIDALIAILQEEAQKRIENGRKEFEEKRSGIAIVDFVGEIKMSKRLQFGLLRVVDYSCLEFIDRITKREFLRHRNSGKKIWEEFIDIIDNRLQGTRFEVQQDFLRKHFKIEH